MLASIENTFGANEVTIQDVTINSILVRSSDYWGEATYHDLVTLRFFNSGQSDINNLALTSTVGAKTCNDKELYIYSDEEPALYAALLAAKAQSLTIDIVVSPDSTRIGSICKLGALKIK